MKKIYLLLLICTLFCFNQLSAIPCPDAAIITGGGTQLTVSYDSPLTCGSMPATVTTSDNGGGTWTLSNCLGAPQNTAFYTLTSGFAPPIGGTLTIDTGFDSSCSYTDSVLPVSEFELLYASASVYPNPLMKSNTLNLKFGLNIIAKISIYTVTGKLAIKDEINNANSKQIDVSGLTNGMYFLKISTDNASTTRKVVIMK